MGRRTSSLVVVAAALLVSLLAHRLLPVSCARHVAVLNVNNNDGSDNRGDMQKLVKKPVSGSADDSAANHEFEGWELVGSRNMEEAEAMGVERDQKENADVRRRPKPQGSQMEQQDLAGSAAARRRRRASSAAESGAVEMRAAGKHGDPTTEVYDMLRRDYAWSASRRKPIHNGEPLQQEEP